MTAGAPRPGYGLFLSTVFRPLIAGALGAGLALGCSGGETPGPVKTPTVLASAAPSATAPAAPPAPPPTSAPEDAAAPTEADHLRALFAIPADPAPEKITLNTHYVVSNEDKQHVYHGAVAGRGGAYVGVGAEQSFLFAGWARSEVMFLMDFDDWVVDINEIHGLAFEHARTPDELVDLWKAEHAEQLAGWIKERWPDEASRERRLKVFEHGRPKVELRLKLLRKWMAAHQKPFFASDQAEFDHVARLWREKRVRCVRGDLTASGALRAFGDLAKRAGWVVRVMYMSNAELYFNYDQGTFRDNLRSLPFDERSIIVHTHPADNAQYHYIWQEAPEYVRWIGRVQSFRDLLYEAKLPRQGKFENGAWMIKPP